MQEQFYTEIFPEKQVVYGTFWERFAACFIDGIILSVANALIGLPFGMSPIPESGDLGGNYLLAQLTRVVVGWLYFALMESGPGGATLGKKVMNLKVTGMEGGRISFGRATGRHFSKLLSAAMLLLGYLMMIWDDKNQTFHDKMASTLVVNSRVS